MPAQKVYAEPHRGHVSLGTPLRAVLFVVPVILMGILIYLIVGRNTAEETIAMSLIVGVVLAIVCSCQRRPFMLRSEPTLAEVQSDHQHWLREIERWQGCFELWENEQTLLERELSRLQQAIERHGSELRAHVAASSALKAEIAASEPWSPSTAPVPPGRLSKPVRPSSAPTPRSAISTKKSNGPITC
jgi:hypothetical protein